MMNAFTSSPGFAGLACLVCTAAAAPVAADGGGAIRCGDVIHGPAQLEHDLACKTDPALTVLGDLDLNGFRVRCVGHRKADDAASEVGELSESDSEGIVLDGRGAILRNGFVEGCFRSVVLAGRGGHLVAQVTASGLDRAFSVEGWGNRLIGNSASTSGNDAFRIAGAGNLLSGNMVTSAGSDGFGVRSRRNVLANNQVQDVGEEGFDVRERDNEIVSNVIRNTGDDGIQVRTGHNLISDNLIIGSAGRGILLGGFLTEGGAEHNDIIGNTVLDGASEGINVDEGFVLQRVLNNTALNNALDLRDQNPDCDDNLWAGNIFDTADPDDCID